ncbi:MAG: cysteine--tRNA ligase [Chloroflexi bacterium]|nr:cysteine--tRNA ligase [Chloroflexota bacterium]
MLRFTNTLTRHKEEFVPREQGMARMYTCGPTVYRYAHIGNMRSYLMADGIRRALEHQGYRVEHVKNITDVGHMRQEMVERGEDKMISAALAEGKSLQEIAAFYTQAFLQDEAKLGIAPATVFPRATDHVAEMIEITQQLVARGYAYVVEGNVYFDVAKYPEYGRLSGNRLASLLEGVRVEVDPQKRNQTDFALWKAAEPGRTVKWPSPWGEGFPGWHIECTAMSTKYLGPQLDLHTGGVDNIFPHHEDELAQSEGAFGVPFVRYWVHGQHLLADGLKMAKSTGNSYTLSDLEERGFDPLAFRYLCLTAHYSARLNFSFQALRCAQHGLAHLRTLVREWALAGGQASATEVSQAWRERFWAHVEDDLGLPQALSVLWKLAQTDLPPAAKLSLVMEFDQALGLALRQVAEAAQGLPLSIQRLAEERGDPRTGGRYQVSDALRQEIIAAGYEVRDRRADTLVLPRDRGFQPDKLVGALSSSGDVPSLLQEPDACQISVNILAHDYQDDLRRCVESVLRHGDAHQLEVVIVDNASTDGAGQWAEELARRDARVRVFHTDHNVGEGTGRNVGLKQSRGAHILLLDTSIELTGDILTPIIRTLSTPDIGATGGWGLCSEDLRHFEDASHEEVDAIEGYCMAFRRELLREVGLLDEKFRFYRNLDLDFSMNLRAHGYRNIMLSGLPVRQHEHRGWASLEEGERDKLSRRNFYRFLSKWGHRTDLLYHTIHGPGPGS